MVNSSKTCVEAMSSPSAPQRQQGEFPVAQNRKEHLLQSETAVTANVHTTARPARGPLPAIALVSIITETRKDSSWPSMALVTLFSRQAMGKRTGLLGLLNQNNVIPFPSSSKCLEKYLGCCWPDLEEPRS